MVILITDALVFFLLSVTAVLAVYVSGKRHLRESFRRVLQSKTALASGTLLLAYLLIGTLDCIHFRATQSDTQSSADIVSVLDVVLSPLRHSDEKTFSAPLSIYSFAKESLSNDKGQVIRDYPRLLNAGKHLADPARYKNDITQRAVLGVLWGLLCWSVLLAAILSINKLCGWQYNNIKKILNSQSDIPWHVILYVVLILFLVIAVVVNFVPQYHVFGTDQVGEDVLYQCLKSIRTGLVIGTVTTLIMLPISLLFGIAAGYFGGWIDDLVQFIYTTLNSIPGVLLIASMVLVMQTYMANHAESFDNLLIRADVRLVALCFILGITSWTGLCRLLRAETLKVREMDYVIAARVSGVAHFKILLKHILPNVMHIVLIAVVLDFSGLVLAEAVLSYIQIGVEPSTYSWGNMINSARLEMAREPVVWWSLTAAFVSILGLVLSANLFADVVRDALDPRTRRGRV
ncbi:MAG: ABC transporter permease [Gammaproteobacteria bacterium]|nr:ABC transporter permease [Gammaproteobacteria bacterium]